MAGGGDWEIVRDHEDQQTAHLDTRYNLLTHDGAVLYLQTTGTRTGKKEVLEALGEGKIGPDAYRMRLHLTFETGDERYSWLNRSVCFSVFICLLLSIMFPRCGLPASQNRGLDLKISIILKALTVMISRNEDEADIKQRSIYGLVWPCRKSGYI